MSVSRTSLTRYARQMQDPDPNGAHKLAARQWHDTGAVVILPASIDRLDWQDRELVRAIATKLYGPRDSRDGQ